MFLSWNGKWDNSAITSFIQSYKTLVFASFFYIKDDSLKGVETLRICQAFKNKAFLLTNICDSKLLNFPPEGAFQLSQAQ